MKDAREVSLRRGCFSSRRVAIPQESRTELPAELRTGDKQERGMGGEGRDLGTLSCDT